MRIPVSAIEKDLKNIENFLCEKVKIIGKDNNKIAVFRRDQWNKINESMSKNSNFPMSEASSLVVRAYTRLIANGNAARSTAQGKIALIAAIMALYNADPGLASNLTYLLD